MQCPTPLSLWKSDLASGFCFILQADVRAVYFSGEAVPVHPLLHWIYVGLAGQTSRPRQPHHIFLPRNRLSFRSLMVVFLSDKNYATWGLFISVNEQKANPRKTVLCLHDCLSKLISSNLLWQCKRIMDFKLTRLKSVFYNIIGN